MRRWVTQSTDEHDIHTRTCEDMVHAANTVTYNMANDDESFNKEMESDSLEWNVMQSPNKKTGVI
jgi:hypothetical protein